MITLFSHLYKVTDPTHQPLPREGSIVIIHICFRPFAK